MSDNAEQWTDVAELPGGEELVDEISLNGKKNARYVRILMQQPANDSRYILSELEVMGKGGLVPAACGCTCCIERQKSICPAATGNFSVLRK